MTTKAHGWGAAGAKDPLTPLSFNRRAVGTGDVAIKIAFCGVCHSDLHTVRNEWHNTNYPIVPGHEIVGHVTAIGAKVKKFKVGDAVGVGCLVDSCLKCEECKHHLEQYCNNMVGTYNSPDSHGAEKITMGGYSDHVVVREEFVLRIPKNLELSSTAPLLCAGITTYSPLRHWNVKKGTKLGVVGLGGLGHMAVKLSHAMGAEVTVFTTSEGKCADAKRLGADHVVLSTDAKAMKEVEGTLNLIIDTVGIKHDLTPYVLALQTDGTHVCVGAPEDSHPPFHPFSLIGKRRAVAGSMIGGIKETQEMLDFCGKHDVVCDVEVIKAAYINEAYERMLKSDVKYRFVIDISSIEKE